MCGGTLISVADCHRMQQQMFMRDSSADVQAKDSWKLAINIVHSGGICLSENMKKLLQLLNGKKLNTSYIYDWKK